MPIVVQVDATAPECGSREIHEATWEHSDVHGVRHPAGRQSPKDYSVGDALDTADAWESREDLDACPRGPGPIADELGVQSAAPLDVAEFLDVVPPLR